MPVLFALRLALAALPLPAAHGREAGASALLSDEVANASLDEFRKLVAAHKGGTAALLVRRGEASVFVPVPVA